MNELKRFLLLGIFAFASVFAYAQITDTQLIKILKDHQEKGSSQVEIMEDLEKKGVSLQRLKMLEKKMKAGELDQTSSESNIDRMREPVVEEHVIVIDESTELPTNTIFGQNLFMNKTLNFEPNLNVPVPEDYVLGPGDEVIIDVWGNSEFFERQVISPEGDVVLRDVGLITLSGLKLKDATKRIKNIYGRYYSDLSSGATSLKVSLGKLRTIHVNILGEVSAPGTYTISSLSSVFHALYVAGGVSPIGSLRNIQVFRGGKLFKSVDVYQYLMKGENSGDIVLKEGDVVLVGTYDIMVDVKGAVKRPLKYEMKVGETVADLLAFAGGFADKAFTKNIHLSRNGADEHQFYTVKEADYQSFDLKNGDEVKVAEILPEFENKVEIMGAVFREGAYAIGNDIKTVKALVEAAGGLKGDAVRDRAILYREAEDYTRYSEAFNLSDLLSGKIADITLQKNDVLFIPSVLISQNEEYITIRGNVKNPGQFVFVKNMTVRDLLLQSGGLLESAYKAKVDIYRRRITESEKAKNDIESFSFSLNDDDEQLTTFVLEPFDEVFVYQAPWYKEQENITVEGEVALPGIYAKLSEGETISSLIKRAGGFTENAYVKGCRLIRQMNEAEIARAQVLLEKAQKDKVLRNDSSLVELVDEDRTYVVGIDFEKIMKNEGGAEDIILREGDRLVVPIYNGVVKISGAVASQSAVPFVKGKSITGYIDLAGGYETRAARCKKYVVYMNGKTRKLCFASQIQPGCEIVVPLKKERRQMSTGEVVGITSSVVSLASVLTTLIVTLAR